VIVALVPPVAALILVALADHDLTEVAPAKPVRKPRVVATVTDIPRKQIAAANETTGQKVTEKVASKTELGLRWAKAQPTTPSVKAIMEGAQIGETTARRVRNELLGK
jgi:hypothetical protein